MATTSCCSSSSSSSQEDYQNIMSDMIAVGGISHVDELISYIDRLLNEERNIGKKAEVDSSIKSAGVLLNKVMNRSRRHICKREFKRKLNRETRKVMIDIANQAAQIKWLGVALSIVAFVLERIEQVSSNTKECKQLLKYMCDLAKYIKQLDEHLTQEKSNRVLQFIVEGSALCISQIRSDSYFSKCLAAPVTAEDLRSLRAELEHDYSDLALEAIIVVLDRIPVNLRPSQGIAHQAVGIEEYRKHVTKLLNMQSKSIIAVVVYGQGGIGKTTLATAVFSKLDLKDYKFCRVDMQQDCSEADLKKLQEQILKDLFGHNVELRNCNEGREELSKEFKKAPSPLFVFVDNALRESDFEKLLPITDLASLPAQSRILLTTRNLNETRIILQPRIQRCAYQVPFLPPEKARKLLCEFALGSLQKSFDPTIDIGGLLQICQGVPLVLKLGGARLREHAESVPDCREAVKYLKTWLVEGEEGELSERMVDFVYNRLGASCKQAFLDIVFFFCDLKRRKVACSVGEAELQELERAALVNITGRRTVNVHDIVKARGKRLSPDGERITDEQSFTDVLENEERIKKIKGFELPEEFQLEARHLNLMKRCLRVMMGSEVNGECKGAFENLRFLYLKKHNYSLMDLSKHPGLAVFIGLFKNRCEFSGVASASASALKYMYIGRATLAYLSTTFSHLQSLRVLKLRDCEGFDNLAETFGNLTALEKLEVHDCNSLTSLPHSFVNLRSLTDLRLDRCEQLSALPKSFGNLASLELLKLHHCIELSHLPHNFGQLKRLKYLSIYGCSQLQSLSGDFECLSSLIVMKASECDQLEGDTIDKLAKMKGLMILDICRSLLVQNRWEQVKEHYSLAVVENRPAFSPTISDEDVMSTLPRAFFNSESKFVYVDDNGQFGESPFPAGGVELSVLLMVCDVTSAANRGYLEAVKKKWEEVESGEKMKVYVEMGGSWEESERRVKKGLPHLPSGARAWIAPDNRARLLFAYSLFRLANRDTEYEPIVIASVSTWEDMGTRHMTVHDFIIYEYTPDFENAHTFDQLFSPISEAQAFIKKK